MVALHYVKDKVLFHSFFFLKQNIPVLISSVLLDNLEIVFPWQSVIIDYYEFILTTAS
jgi:hypothetical protein